MLTPQELFELASDPGEPQNLMEAKSVVAAECRAAMEAEVSAMQPHIVKPTETELSDEQLQRLRNMGYIK